MKQSLQLRLGHHLTMTPQLQQAIRLLQLSTLELRAEVQETLERNPLLELEEGEGEEERYNGEDTSADAGDDSDYQRQVDSVIPDNLPVDTTWDDIYDATPVSAPLDDTDGSYLETANGASESLHDHLIWQMGLTPFSEIDRAIAATIIDGIDDAGYLVVPLEDIQQGVSDEVEVDRAEVEAVLHRIQNFDPPGIGARDLRECLLLQLHQLPTDTPWLNVAERLVRDHLSVLAGHDYNQLMRRLSLSHSQLQEVVALIQSLTPRPGSLVATGEPEYVVPDVVVRKQDGAWRVELNPEAMPRLRINAHYAGMIKRADDSDDNSYLKSQLQEARWFIKSMRSRNETLLKVASCIVERQRGFLEHGEEAMKALVLHDVAEEVGMHESTISRVTTRKYMLTPRGIYELKYFFSSHVTTASGEECSATAIRALIKKLVSAESPSKPLSDSKIASILKEQGINVARRTVAKYREAMHIPPSNERKQLV